MLFNSLVFLLLFLPCAVVLHELVSRARPTWRVPLLVALSIVYYASWDAGFAPLLAASIILNWLAAKVFASTRLPILITVAIALNLLLLGVYKYLDFFTALLPGASAAPIGLAVPLGISFFTFQHIMYLADMKAGRTGPATLGRYALYVAFFPRLIAGPLVRPGEFFPQLDSAPLGGAQFAERLALGLMLLTAGLAKKVFLGDPLADLVDPVYAGVAAGTAPTVLEAWQATLGYTFQLYFDFSGYTDMALGLALLFGIVLPQNFQAPYRATSIQDFWRRWHITLSHFLRDYLYIPFGGSRHGLPRQVLALFATMLLGGLWHGAGWTFIAWGGAHGAALGVHLIWRKAGFAMPSALGWVLTLLFVALAWVLFRSPSFSAALTIYGRLLGFGPLGVDFQWPLLAVAALIATVGPTTLDSLRRAAPSRWAGVLAALLLSAVLLKVGDDSNRDFIYAQF
jgi:D-alanyl-lipoteichoic acid acyltransferase DltB (MBOAT superfamily)